MKKSRRVMLFALLFGTMLIFGFIDNIRGVSYPLIRDEFSVSFERQGFMISMLSLAYVVSNILAGIFLGRFGIKPAAFAGYSAVALGLVYVYFSPGFSSVVIALVLISAGFGFIEIGINALASRVFVAKAALLMNLLHSFFGIGSMLGPPVAGAIAGGAGLGWRAAYLFSLPLALLIFALAMIARFPKEGEGVEDESPAPNADSGERKSFFDALKSPLVWLMALALGLALVLEVSTPNWGPLYFQDLHGLDPTGAGATFLSAFFLLFTLARLLCGPLIEKIGYVRSLLAAAILSLAVFALGFALGENGIFALPALGFLVALFWPTLMAVAIISFGKDAPVFAGATIAIAGLINTVVQFLVGLTNSAIGPAWGYRSSMIYTIVLIFALLALYKKLKARGIKKI
ncbi:MAG: MFS transporter [Treponema sp.]|nr:MFS transporter [Treponema sp.]